MFVWPFVRLSFVCLPVPSFVCLLVVGLFVRSSACLFVCLFVCSFVCLFVFVVLVRTFNLSSSHLGTLWAPLAISLAPLATPWAPFGYPWAPIGHPWARIGHPSCHCGRPLATSGIVGTTFWSPGVPIWHHLDTPWTTLLPSWKRVSKKVKKTLFLATCLVTFKEGCTCESTMPVQSNTHIGQLFLTHVFKPRKAANIL